MDQQDKDFIDRIKFGDKPIFDQVFLKYYKGLCMFANKMIQNMDVAEEIVQDLFCKIWEKREEIVFKTSLKAYLFTSVRNNCIDYIRHVDVKQNYAKEYIKEWQETNFFEDNTYVDKEMLDIIYKAIDELPTQRQKIFRMNRFQGLKYREIAEELNISIKTVEAHMGSALKQLRKRLKTYVNLMIFIAMFLL